MEKKFGPMMQMAFVVEDFDEPIEFWTKRRSVFHAQVHHISSQTLVDFLPKSQLNFGAKMVNF